MRFRIKGIERRLAPREQEVYFGLISAGKRVATTKWVMERLGTTRVHASQLLQRLARKRALQRVGRGIYVVVPPEGLLSDEPAIDPFSIIDQLMKELGLEYYVGHSAAAFLHGIADEIPFAVDVVCGSRRRPVRLGHSLLRFRPLRAPATFGIVRMRQSGEFLTVSDLERTLLDCAGRLELCGGPRGLFQLAKEGGRRLDARRLYAHGRRSGDRAAIRRLGWVLTHLRIRPASKAAAALSRVLEKGETSRPIPLDPTLPKKGRPDLVWGVIANADLRE